MSIRPAETVEVHPLRAQITALQQAHAQAETHAITGESLAFNSLSEVEKSAASLGVSPDDLKPIEFMNRAHYKSLLQNNAIDSRLCQQVEAFKHVSAVHS